MTRKRKHLKKSILITLLILLITIIVIFIVFLFSNSNKKDNLDEGVSTINSPNPISTEIVENEDMLMPSPEETEISSEDNVDSSDASTNGLTVIETDSYSFTFAEIYEINPMQLVSNGESYGVPSSASVYCVTVDAKSLNGESITVVDARYTSSSGTTYTALDRSVSSSRAENLIGMYITNNQQGGLYFITIGDSLNSEGILEIKLSDSDEFITVSK